MLHTEVKPYQLIWRIIFVVFVFVFVDIHFVTRSNLLKAKQSRQKGVKSLCPNMSKVTVCESNLAYNRLTLMLDFADVFVTYY